MMASTSVCVMLGWKWATESAALDVLAFWDLNMCLTHKSKFLIDSAMLCVQVPLYTNDGEIFEIKFLWVAWPTRI